MNCINETKEGFEGKQGEATVNGKTRKKSDVNQNNAIVEIIDNSCGCTGEEDERGAECHPKRSNQPLLCSTKGMERYKK